MKLHLFIDHDIRVFTTAKVGFDDYLNHLMLDYPDHYNKILQFLMDEQKERKETDLSEEMITELIKAFQNKPYVIEFIDLKTYFKHCDPDARYKTTRIKN